MNGTMTPVVPNTKEGILKLAEQFPDFCKPIFDDVIKKRSEILKQMSAQVPNAVISAQAANAANTYRPVGGVSLEKVGDGLYSTALHDDETGRFTQNVKLEKAASDVARAATFAYSVLNAAVGQANMMSIAERLASIETKLDEAKKRDYINKCEEVYSACVGIKEVLCLSDFGHRQQTILERRQDLRTALGTLREYIKNDIKEMPEYHEKTFREKILSNWGTENSTLPMKAKQRFEYVVMALPVWCRGMSFYVMTDSYIDSDGTPYQSATEMINGLREMLEDSRLANRVKYLPMMGNADPIKIIDQFTHCIPDIERTFERMRNKAIAGEITIPFSRD